MRARLLPDTHVSIQLAFLDGTINILADASLFRTAMPTHAARIALIRPPTMNGANPPKNAAVHDRPAANLSHAVPIINVTNMPITFAINALVTVNFVFSR